jgi:hypothetical protein
MIRWTSAYAERERRRLAATDLDCTALRALQTRTARWTACWELRAFDRQLSIAKRHEREAVRALFSCTSVIGQYISPK